VSSLQKVLEQLQAAQRTPADKKLQAK
jgi:hypothetical protein